MTSSFASNPFQVNKVQRRRIRPIRLVPVPFLQQAPEILKRSRLRGEKKFEFHAPNEIPVPGSILDWFPRHFHVGGLPTGREIACGHYRCRVYFCFVLPYKKFTRD